MKQRNTTFLILGIMMIGVVLRMPFTAIPPILHEIAAEFSIPISELGMLTTLPLIMFALFSPFAAKLGQRFGLEKLFAMALVLMLIGSTLRIFSLSLLFIGTAFIGISIAVLNVLLPSTIMANYPSRLGKLTLFFINDIRHHHRFIIGNANYLRQQLANNGVDLIRRFSDRTLNLVT